MSRIVKIILVIGALFQVTSSYAQVVDSDSLCEGSIYIKTDDYEGVIFGLNCPENWKDDKSYRWSPTEEDIAMAENLMKECIIKIVRKRGLTNQNGTPIIHLNFDRYIRQYRGCIDRRGRKIICVNCFWKEYENKHPQWKRYMVGVCDGGSYYWSIKINLKKKKCFDYFIHA